MEKAGINQLGAHEIFKTKYSITVKIEQNFKKYVKKQ